MERRHDAGRGVRGGALVRVVVGVAVLAALAVATPPLLAWRAAAVLSTAVMPPDRVRVEADTPARELARGRIARISLAGRRVTVSGLPVQEVEAELRSMPIRFLRDGTLSPEAGAVGKLWFSVTGEGLTRFLREARGINGVEVRFASREVAVTSLANLVGFGLRVEVRGLLEVAAERRVLLIARRVHVSGVGVPEHLAAAVMSRVNPIFDASTLPVPLRITGLMVGDGVVTVHLAMP